MSNADPHEREKHSHRVLRSLPRAGAESVLGFIVLASVAAILLPPPSEFQQVPVPGQTPTTAPLAIFDLSSAKVDWDREGLQAGSAVVVILVPAHKDGTPLPSYEELRFDNAKVMGVLDANGNALQPRYPADVTIRLAIPRGEQDEDAIRFADLLNNIGRILILPTS